MRKNLAWAAIMAAGAAVFWSGRVEAQNADQATGGQQPGADDMKAMMEGMQKYLATTKPGKPHEQLESFAGTWDTVTRMWMAGPGSPPIETKGVSVVESALGGRFLVEHHKGEMKMPDMATGAMKTIPYEGFGLLGYNNARKMYEQFWASSADTHILSMTGAMDPAGKVLTMYGQMDEVMLGVVGRTVKYVTRIVDEDKHVFDIIDLHAGDDYKVIEITYTRRK